MLLLTQKTTEMSYKTRRHLKVMNTPGTHYLLAHEVTEVNYLSVVLENVVFFLLYRFWLHDSDIIADIFC